MRQMSSTVSRHCQKTTSIPMPQFFKARGGTGARLLNAQVKGSLYQAPSGQIRCGFCPVRAFTNASQVHRHMTLYHLGKSFCVCSGKKRQRAFFALHDSDSRSGVQPFELLARSAVFSRQSVYPPLGDNFNNINRQIRLILTGKGAIFANLASIGMTLALRHVVSLYHSRCFANVMFRVMIFC